MRAEFPIAAIALFCSLAISHFLEPNTLAAALPGPPVFEAISHYPSFCYLPPESGLCSPNKTAASSAELSSPKFEQDNRLTAQSENNFNDDEIGSVQGPLLTRFYFDSITAQCYPFGAQECGGNQNRFRTAAECMAKCRYL